MLHGPDGAHAAVALIAAALEQNDFAGGFFGAGKHATHHHRTGARGQSLGNITAIANTAIGNQRNARTLERRGHVVNGHDLRHANTCHDAGGANGTRANTDLDCIGARFSQCQGCGAGGNIAADHINVRVVALDPAHTFDDAMAVAVGRVHHNGVNAGPRQRFDPLFRALAHSDRCTHPQLALRVTRSVGEAGLLGNVFDSNQSFELKSVVHYQQTLNFVLVQQHLGFADRGAVGHGDQFVLRRHDLADRQVVTGLKAQIPAGHNAYDLAAFTHREAGHPQLVGQRHDLAHRVGRRNHDRIAQNARLVALDLGHLRGLLGSRQVLVDDTNAAFLGDGDGQPGLGNGIHGRRCQRQVQRNIAGEAGGE